MGLPDAFPDDALEEARQAAAAISTRTTLLGREDFTADLTVVTIDPVDARDFDDAVSLTIDPKSKHWQLGVHIADVGHFAPPGGALDREARKRGTSVYLPQRVIPMFPEIISNSLASLAAGPRPLRQERPDRLHADRAEDRRALRQRRHQGRQRFTYEQVSAILRSDDGRKPTGR